MGHCFVKLNKLEKARFVYVRMATAFCANTMHTCSDSPVLIMMHHVCISELRLNALWHWIHNALVVWLVWLYWSSTVKSQSRSRQVFSCCQRRTPLTRETPWFSTIWPITFSIKRYDVWSIVHSANPAVVIIKSIIDVIFGCYFRLQVASCFACRTCMATHGLLFVRLGLPKSAALGVACVS